MEDFIRIRSSLARECAGAQRPSAVRWRCVFHDKVSARALSSGFAKDAVSSPLIGTAKRQAGFQALDRLPRPAISLGVTNGNSHCCRAFDDRQGICLESSRRAERPMAGSGLGSGGRGRRRRAPSGAGVLRRSCFADHGSHRSRAVDEIHGQRGPRPVPGQMLEIGYPAPLSEQHQELEGTWDPMEGRSRIASTFAEFCKRHRVRDLPHGARLAAVEATYETDDTSLIYCTSRATDRVSRHAQWRVASRIRDARKFAVVLGAQFARQCDEGRHTAVTGLDLLIGAAVGSSGLDSAVHVHHGPVVYDDNAGDVLFARIPEHARGLAAHFFKRTEFEDQQEYRFVLSAPGGRPIKDEFYLKITADLRSIFERQ